MKEKEKVKTRRRKGENKIWAFEKLNKRKICQKFWHPVGAYF